MEFFVVPTEGTDGFKANKKERSTERLIAVPFSERISGALFCFIRNNIQDVKKP